MTGEYYDMVYKGVQAMDCTKKIRDSSPVMKVACYAG